MNNNSIGFANKRDSQFLRDNAQLNKELFIRKLKYKEILIAKVEDRQVGFLIFEYLWSHIPFIAQIWIHADYRKKGIGKSLLNYFEKYLRENNYTILLSSSMENAIEAQAWHKHMGFIDSGLISKINDDNTDEVFFRKSLE